MTRRRFIALVGAVAAATGLPREVVAQALQGSPNAAAAAAQLTTLAETLGPGPAADGGWRPVVTRPGEPYEVRDDLAAPQEGRERRRRSLLHFLHLTDQHVIDAQSPVRGEWLDRYSDGDTCPDTLTSTHRAAEVSCARVADAMLQRARRIAVSPVTGAPIAAAVCTGDNTDNQQNNELDVHLALMNGGRVNLQSGDPERYEGVQRSGSLDYWHPDGEVEDKYRQLHGFPVSPSFLDSALAPFDAVGAGVPWYSCYGNHDGLIQGNLPLTPALGTFAVGSVKLTEHPPGANPCALGDVIGAPTAPAMVVTADPERRFIYRGEWIRKHLESGGLPHGHGFTEQNADEELAYWAADIGPLRWVGLDTVNPGGTHPARSVIRSSPGSTRSSLRLRRSSGS